MLKKKLNIYVLITCLTVSYGYSQENATLIIKDTIIGSSTEFNLLSPSKAAFYSAVLTGLGQAYNKKYWKIPLVYAGFGTIGYFIGWNSRNYQIIRSAYIDFTDKDPLTDSYLDLEGSKYYDLESPSSKSEFKYVLNKQQDYYRRNRDLLVITMAYKLDIKAT